MGPNGPDWFSGALFGALRGRRRSPRSRRQRGGGGRPVPSAWCLTCLGEAAQVQRPAALGADAFAHRLPAVAIEVPELEFHARAVWPLGDEPYLDLARHVDVGLELPL